MINVFVIEDHEVVRDGLKYAFSRAGDITVAGEAASSVQALKQLRAKNFAFDVVLLDIGLPDKSGIALLADLRHEAPALPVLFLSSYAENEFIWQVLREGARGYVAKGTDTKTLIGAVRTVANGGTYVSSAALETLAAQSPTKRGSQGLGLSSREHEILMGLAKGNGLTEIGRNLNLSVKTVSTYRARILEKTGFRTNAELTRYALNHNLIS